MFKVFKSAPDVVSGPNNSSSYYPNSVGNLHKRENSIEDDDDDEDLADCTHKCLVFEKKGQKFEYTGTVNSKGEFVGRGELKYPNGSVYDGEFRSGKRHGFGKLKFPDQSFVVGRFYNNQPAEDFSWKIVYGESSDVYFGKIKLEKSKKLSELLNISDFLKHQEGEMLYYKYDIKYFGTFVNNQRDGYGIIIFGSNGDRYYGGFKDDKYHDFGSYIYSDGTVFHGKWVQGKKQGKGLLLLPNGDRLEGIWKGDQIESAMFTKGDCSKSSVSALNLLSQKIQAALRSLTGYNMADIVQQQQQANSPSAAGDSLLYQTSIKWQQYFELYKKNWERQTSEIMKNLKFMQLATPMDDVLKNILEKLLCEDKDEFVCKFVQFFVSAFQGSFFVSGRQQNSRSGSSKQDISYAIDDINSFIYYLNYLLYNFLFSEAKLENVHSYRNFIFETLSRHIHEKAYQTLFPLYEQSYEEKDLMMNQKISSLRTNPLIALGVDAKFCPAQQSNEVPYAESIRLLESIRSKCTPEAKIKVLELTRDSIMHQMRKYRQDYRMREKGDQYSEEDFVLDAEWQPGGEDVTSPFSYVWLMASITNHHAQFHYLSDWKPHGVELTPVQWSITFYEGFLGFILDLDPNLKSDNGMLVSNYQISKNIENALESEMKKNKRQKQFVSFFWLSSLLIFIQCTVGSQKIVAGDKIPLPQDSLSEAICKNIESVKSILENTKDIGFSVDLLTENSNSPYVLFSRIYPSHIYAEMSLNVAKFLRSEQ